MPTQRLPRQAALERTRSQRYRILPVPDVSTGGGGTIGKVVWGPQFGNNEVSSFAANATIDYAITGLVGELAVQAAIEMVALAQTGNMDVQAMLSMGLGYGFDQNTVQAAIELVALAMTGETDVQAAIDMTDFALTGNLNAQAMLSMDLGYGYDQNVVRAAIDMVALALQGDLGVQAAWDTTNLALTYQDLNVRALVEMVALALVGETQVNVTLTGNTSLVTDFADVRAAIDMAALSLFNDSPVAALIEMVALTLQGNEFVSTTLDGNYAPTFDEGVASAPNVTAVNLVNGSSVQTALNGSMLGAPIWQSQNADDAEANQTDETVPIPAGTVEGDFLLAFLWKNQLGEWTAPTGWTKILHTQRDGVTDCSMTSFYKFAGATEPADYTWSTAANTAKAGNITRVLGVNTTTPVNQSVGSQGSAINPVTGTVTTTTINCLIFQGLVQINAIGQSYTPPAGYSERTDFQMTVLDVNNGDVASATKPQSAAAATGAQTFTSAGLTAADYATQTIAIAPAAVPI